MTAIPLASAAAGLVDQLSVGGALTAEWRTTFQAVPRQLFVPDLVWHHLGNQRGIEPVHRSDQPDAWLKLVYQDEFLVTQINDGATPAGAATGVVSDVDYTSSTSMPSVVAEMLAVLRVEPGMRVLEIGTGTGWNTALLAHRLGAQSVTSRRQRAASRAAVQQAAPALVSGQLRREDHDWHPVPRCKYDYTPPDQDDPDGILWFLDQWSGSWAAVHHRPDQDGPFLVRQYGPRQLLDEVSAAYRDWKQAGNRRRAPGGSPSHQKASTLNSLTSGHAGKFVGVRDGQHSATSAGDPQEPAAR